MGCEEDVLKIKKKLDKISLSKTKMNQNEVLDILKTLQELPIDLQILTKTRIGMTVNALRKSSTDNDIISTSKQLIKSWKKFVPDKKDEEEVETKEGKKKEKEEKRESNKNGANNIGGSTSNSNSASSNDLGGNADSFPSLAPTTDSLRLKCREMISNALKGNGELPDGIVNTTEALAELTEDSIYQEFRNTDAAYKNRVRSRVYNLKDQRNPQLRENVLLGHITPERLGSMTSEEMASAEMKQIREKFTKESIDDHQLAIAQGTKTDLLKCGKCGQRNCTYNQMQTRSADEPMTTFVMCNACGNRWKFC